MKTRDFKKVGFDNSFENEMICLTLVLEQRT